MCWEPRKDSLGLPTCRPDSAQSQFRLPGAPVGSCKTMQTPNALGPLGVKPEVRCLLPVYLQRTDSGPLSAALGSVSLPCEWRHKPPCSGSAGGKAPPRLAPPSHTSSSCPSCQSTHPSQTCRLSRVSPLPGQVLSLSPSHHQHRVITHESASPLDTDSVCLSFLLCAPASRPTTGA